MAIIMAPRSTSQLFEEVKDIEFVHIAWSEAGHIKRKLGDYEGAAAIYRQTIVGFQEIGNRAAVAHQLECFGMLAAVQGRDI